MYNWIRWEELIAICDKLLNEQILIAGQYGGGLPERTKQGEQVLIQETSEHIRTVTFIYDQDKKIKIFESYGPYICGFSYDGNYFMIVDDAGIIVLKRFCSILYVSQSFVLTLWSYGIFQ